MNPLGILWLAAEVVKRGDHWPEGPKLSNQQIKEGIVAWVQLLGVLALILAVPAFLVWLMIFGEPPPPSERNTILLVGVLVILASCCRKS